MKKVLKIALFSVMGLVVLLGIAVWLEFGHLVKGANSCVKLDDGLYYMEYKGDDGFDGLMAKGGHSQSRRAGRICHRIPVEGALQARNQYIEAGIRMLGTDRKHA